MKESQLQKMSYPQLVNLQHRVAAAIASKRNEERDALRKKMQSIAEKAGFRIGELFTSGRERPVAGTPLVKYRHPTNRMLIWSGRGRRPKWLTAEGGDIERFRVA